MPIPIVIAVVGAIGAAVETAASVYTAWLAAGVIDSYKREILAAVESTLTLNMGPLVTQFANERLSQAGIGLVITDITDIDQTKADADEFVTDAVNAKAGTQFESIANITRDEFMTEAGRVLSERISQEIGIDIEVWPPSAFKQSVAGAIESQIVNGVEGLLSADLLAQIEQAIIIKLELTLPPDGGYIPADVIRKRRLAALRQKEYRSKNKRHCAC